MRLPEPNIFQASVALALAHGGPGFAVTALVCLTAHLAGIATASELDVRSFAQAPAFSLPALSPDGARLSYVQQSDDAHTVLIRTLRSNDTLRTLNVESKRARALLRMGRERPCVVRHRRSSPCA